jgi:RNase adapter protein RapZ
MNHAEIDAPHVLVVTGMSGAGRSSSAKILEDLGYTVIDNLPPTLLGLVGPTPTISRKRTSTWQS